MTNASHEHDEDGNCIPPQGYSVPTWRFSAWDVAGIITTGVAGLFTVVGQAGNLLAREFAAMANWSRQNSELREAQAGLDAQRAAAAEELRRMVEGDLS